jgi:hypothetical protein
MAQMFPKKPLNDTQSKSEIDLFYALEHQLSNSYLAFHSVAWQIPDTIQGVSDGETDFVILDPNTGLLIIEVKGGDIKYDGRIGKWYSNGYEITDPIKQARKAKYSLLKKLKEHPELTDQFIFVGYAVSFPDTRIEKALKLDAPRELIMDYDDISNLEEWIKFAFIYIKNENRSMKSSLNPTQTRIITSMLSPSWNFHPIIEAGMKHQDKLLRKLTEEQYRLLDYLQRERKVSIAGCAGSGKTLVALEKSLRLESEGFSVLFLCNNPYLAKDLNNKTYNSKIQVYSFPDWINSIINNEFENNTNEWTFYFEPTDEQLNLALNALLESNRKYDAIVVDEGQDFREDWWILIEAALNDTENGIIYIFHDDNQALYPYGSQFKYPIKPANIVMSRNCRNMGNIFNIVKRLHSQAPEVSLELKDLGIVKDFVYERDNRMDAKTKCLKAIREMSNYIQPPGRIVVITTEMCPVNESILNNANCTPLDKYKWQNIIRYNLSNYISYYNPLELSNEDVPTTADIKNVSDFVKKIGVKQHLNSLLVKDSQYHVPKWIDLGSDVKSKETRRGDGIGFLLGDTWPNLLPPQSYPIKLTACTQEIRPSYRQLNLYRKYDSESYFEEIPLFDIASFKGLEAEGVIFFHWGYYSIGDANLFWTNLYVGISRAKHFLFFVSNSTLDNLIDLINE